MIFLARFNFSVRPRVTFPNIHIFISIRVTLKMKEKKSIKEIKEMMGLNYCIHDTRAELEKMIDPNKYYLVRGYALPFMGATVLKKNFQPALVEQDLGYHITAAQWKQFNEVKEQQQAWIKQRQQYQEEE